MDQTDNQTNNQLRVYSTAHPRIPVGHPDYKWTSGADVQATWHRHTGWTPPSGRWVKPLEQQSGYAQAQ